MQAPRTRAVIAWWKHRREPRFLYTKACCDYCGMPRVFAGIGQCYGPGGCYNTAGTHMQNFYKDPWPWNTYWSVVEEYDVRRRPVRQAGS
jgi:hypothetical protein